MLGWTIAWLFVGPPVQVDARALELPEESVALQGQVLERILEAGHALQPGARSRVVLSASGSTITIELHAGEQRWSEVVNGTGRDAAVVRLEVAQRVIAMLSELASAPATSPTDPAAGGHAVHLDPNIEDVTLRRRLLAHLVDGNIAVVAQRDQAQFVVCASQAHDGSRVAFIPAVDGDCDQALTTTGATTSYARSISAAWAAVRWPDAQQSAAVAEADPDPDPGEASAEPSAVRPPNDQPAPTSQVDPIDQPRPKLETVLSADVGATSRPTLSGRYGVSAEVGRTKGLSGLVELSATPSQGAGNLKLTDVGAVLGLAWRFRLGAQWRIVPGLAVGARMHIAHFTNGPARAAFDPSVVLPTRVQWRPHPIVVLGVRVAPGFDGRAREHLLNGVSVWRRGPWRLDFGLQLGVAL